jgi:murein hydrolase activator
MSDRSKVAMTRIVPVVLLALAATPLAGQELRQEIRDSQLRLEQIRQERAALEREMESLRSALMDVSSRLANIERQRLASANALREIDFQSAALATSVESTTRELIMTQDRLRERSAMLDHRLRYIYKQGPMHSVRVLLSAQSFGNLLNRYKYLHMLALQDQRLLREVEGLQARLVVQDRELKRALADIQQLRAAKLEEFARLQAIENQQVETLRGVRQQERQTADRLERLARDEARIGNLISDLERRRVEAERRRTATGAATAAPATISTEALGSLDWPVDGQIIYRFGPERRPNGIVLRWNGIGIAAPAGTPVRAVEAGTVMMAGTSEGYGPSVIISHGGGYYTLYLYLQRIQVQEGQQIAARQVIGTVGGDRTREGPHVEFQVRAPVRGGVPEPVDPLAWLRERTSR